MRSVAAHFASALDELSGLKLPAQAYTAMAEQREKCVQQWVSYGASQDVAERYAEQAIDHYKAYSSLCESPIEHLAMIAMATTVLPTTQMPRFYDMRTAPVWPSGPVLIAPQFPVGRYRLDFVVSVRSHGEVTAYALECDGADYHTDSSDKDADTVRDGFVAHLGIETKRLSGSAIYKHPERIQQWLCSLVEGRA